MHSENLAYNFTKFNKAIVLVDSKAAIQAITQNKVPESETIRECRTLLKFFENQKKWVGFQWIPSHIGILGNEIADTLAKRGTQIQILVNPEPHLRRKMEEVKKTWDHENTINNQAAAKGKQWEKAEELAKQMKLKGRKEAVAKFRLKSGHDCLPQTGNVPIQQLPALY